MREVRWRPTDRQREALTILNDKVTTELFFGGGAGGGKSYLGCVWLIMSCLRYPGTRWLMGRARLKSLKESTFLTFLGILKEWGLKKDKDWRYNAMEGCVYFTNGSTVYLKDLFLYPTDPEFDSLGSTEYTGAFMDEVSEITLKAKNIVTSRIRYKLDMYDLIPKTLMASNPSKNFAYKYYWKPWKEGTLEKYRKFVPALVGDNPYMTKHYEQNLQKLDKNSKERLLYGNWEFDDDPSRLFEYNKILDIFTGDYRAATRLNKIWYISADVARFGADKSVIIVWKGLIMKKIYVAEKQSVDITKDMILHLASVYGVPNSNIVIDDDGIGGAGVVDYIRGSIGFVNNSRPFKLPPGKLLKQNFANLKTECWFKLVELVHSGQIYADNIPEEAQTLIIEDLEQIKLKSAIGTEGKVIKEGKLDIMPKEEIKERLGRSTDYGDAIMMRMLFEVRNVSRPAIAI